MISNCFYYGVYSPKGFYSLAAKTEFLAKKNYIVKGYSTSAKQMIFDSIKKELDNRGQSYVDFCADERSIGVYSADAGFRIIDGTYDSFTYNAEVFDLGEETKEIRTCLADREEAVKRAARFLTACRCISNDMARIDSSNLDIVKINRFSSRLWSSMGGTLKGTVGMEHKRFVTCFTSGGVELNMEAFDIYCENITVICDRSGTCARHIVDRVRRYALSAGYNVISCLCPLNIESGAEHLIIPELKTGIFVCKYFHKCYFEKCRRVSSARFLVPSETETKKRMDFSFKAYKRLMQEVFSSLETVNLCDEEIDRFSAEPILYDRQAEFVEKLFSS